MLELWMEELMCEKNKHEGRQTQLRCQKLCEDDPECIGISYHRKTYNCILCTKDEFGEFFKRPPGNAQSINMKQLNLERICI